jgi:hypothetical protein
LGVWNSDQQHLVHQTIHFRFEKIQRNGQRTYSEPLILRAFFEQTRQSFEFFLKLRTSTYFKSEVLIKSQNPGCLNVKIFKNSDQEVITKSENHPTHGWEGRQDVVFHCSILKQSLHVVGWCHSAHKVSSFQYLLHVNPVKPNTSGFTQGAPGFPLHILHHAGSLIASN